MSLASVHDLTILRADLFEYVVRKHGTLAYKINNIEIILQLGVKVFIFLKLAWAHSLDLIWNLGYALLLLLPHN